MEVRYRQYVVDNDHFGCISYNIMHRTCSSANSFECTTFSLAAKTKATFSITNHYYFHQRCSSTQHRQTITVRVANIRTWYKFR